MKQLLDADDVARLLQLSKSHAYHLMRTGEIRTVRIGARAVRVTEEDLEAYVELQKEAPGVNWDQWLERAG